MLPRRELGHEVGQGESARVVCYRRVFAPHGLPGVGRKPDVEDARVRHARCRVRGAIPLLSFFGYLIFGSMRYWVYFLVSVSIISLCCNLYLICHVFLPLL